MLDKKFFIPLTNKELKIIRDNDTSYVFEEAFQEISLISKHTRKIESQGPLSKFEIEEIDNDKYDILPIYMWDTSINITGDSDNSNGFLVYEKYSYTLVQLKSFVKSLEAILSGEVYGYELVEMQKCNMDCYHEVDGTSDSCWGFYSGESDTRKDIIQECLSNEEILSCPEIIEFLGEEILTKIRLSDLAS